MRDVRCAIYTRKSTEEGLDQEFNSLDAQRAACEAYIEARRLDGWILINDHYDDGGYSGGNMKRPQFQRLLSDIRDRKVDMVVLNGTWSWERPNVLPDGWPSTAS